MTLRPKPHPIRLGVLISGTGTNLSAVLEAVAEKRLHAEVALVISNRAAAQGLERARDHGVKTAVLSHKAFADRESFDAAIVALLREAGVEWVVLAGFMRVVTPVLLDAFPDRVVNIHPSLLPSFPGIDAQAQAIAYGARVSGCTVHLVDQGVDTGPVIAQTAVPVFDSDDRDSLAARILQEEHRLLVSTLALVGEGRLEVAPREGGRRHIRIRRKSDP